MDKRRKYTKEFKLDAIKLFNDSGKSLRQIETDLGISQGNLAKWVRDHETKKEDAFPGNGFMSGKDAEIFQLKKENAILREEREILKKVMGIFTGPKR